MNYDYSKRGYLLPEGCKDLIDVFCYTVHEGCKVLIDFPRRRVTKTNEATLPVSAPKIVRELAIPIQTSVQELAALLGQHPSQIIVDLLELGIYSCVVTQLEFSAIYKVARKYGYKAKSAA